uniref:Uncharacterized protein n=1 Tax=Peronospora matthiolae TaxID=2874970 RepID=A0AAV1T0X5_9STRA
MLMTIPVHAFRCVDPVRFDMGDGKGQKLTSVGRRPHRGVLFEGGSEQPSALNVE